jgi:hypothetical protein
MSKKIEVKGAIDVEMNGDYCEKHQIIFPHPNLTKSRYNYKKCPLCQILPKHSFRWERLIQMTPKAWTNFGKEKGKEETAKAIKKELSKNLSLNKGVFKHTKEKKHLYYEILKDDWERFWKKWGVVEK